jgi:hypothetical protein
MASSVPSKRSLCCLGLSYLHHGQRFSRTSSDSAVSSILEKNGSQCNSAALTLVLAVSFTFCAQRGTLGVEAAGLGARAGEGLRLRSTSKVVVNPFYVAIEVPGFTRRDLTP